ncbi:peptide deformylase [Pseudomonas sp. NPDC089396]|uniref:peptide deformylase n=1 Tax=Pseudomonas sp. NPDC089396 TaxID=3364461 RepID=UPI003839CF69
MAILGVLRYPDPRLSKSAHPVEVFGHALEELVSDMLETMYHHQAIGLSAPQVNVKKQVVVVDLSENQSSPLVLINPMVSSAAPDHSHFEEGCVSIPGFYLPIRRSRSIQIEALDAQGHSFSMIAEGWLAACIQHEIDHLNGQTLMDHATMKQRSQYRRSAHR